MRIWSIDYKFPMRLVLWYQSSDQGVTQLLTDINNEVSVIEERAEDLNKTPRPHLRILNQTEMKPASFSAFPSNVAVARQPNR